MTSWTVAHQAPLSLGFPGQEYWSGLPLPFPEIFFFFGPLPGRACGIFVPDQGLNSCPLHWKHSLNHWTPGKSQSLSLYIHFAVALEMTWYFCSSQFHPCTICWGLQFHHHLRFKPRVTTHLVPTVMDPTILFRGTN